LANGQVVAHFDERQRFAINMNDPDYTLDVGGDGHFSTNLVVDGTLTLGSTAITATAAELNILDGVTSTAAELNILDGVTATAAELNALDGITATVTELNYTDGVTSNIQTQLNAITSFNNNNTTLTGTTVVAAIDLSGDIDVDGTANLDAVDIDGNVQADGTITVGTTSSASSTDYSEVALTSLSPSTFNQTYTRQSTGFVLDTGTAASGNALFKAANTHYYYVASTGPANTGRALIFSEEDNKYVVIFDMSSDLTEGNVSDNQAVGSVFTDDVTASTQTQDGRLVPGASGDIVFASSGGASGQGYDVKFFGDANSTSLLWDASADDLILSGEARVVIPDGQLVLGSTAVTSTAAELNILDGVTATAAELNHTDGVTSNIQTQLNAKLSAETITLTAFKAVVAASSDFADFKSRVSAL